jgi:hypothetical protein
LAPLIGLASVSLLVSAVADRARRYARAGLGASKTVAIL